MVRLICKLAFCLMLSLLAPLQLTADDVGAREKIEEAIAKERDRNYFAAAELYQDAELLADDTTLKANALKAAANAFRQSKWNYKEFECNESLIRGFPNHIPFVTTVERQFELGDLYYAGYRQPASEFFRWTGITGKNYVIEIYEKALEHGPFSTRAPIARLRLGRLLIERNEKGDLDKGLETLRSVVKDYPGTLEQKNARLELANVLAQKAIRGDVSEVQTEEAREILNQCLLLYPNDPELPWVRDTLTRLDEAAAQRLLNIAKYYQHIGNDAGMAFSLYKLMKNYSRTETAKSAEQMLSEIQPSVTPPAALPVPDSLPLIKPEIPFFERRDILVVPANSDGKWLLPIEDYAWDLDRNRAERAERFRKEAEMRKKSVPGGGNGLPEKGKQ